MLGRQFLSWALNRWASITPQIRPHWVPADAQSLCHLAYGHALFLGCLYGRPTNLLSESWTLTTGSPDRAMPVVGEVVDGNRIRGVEFPACVESQPLQAVR